MKKKFDTKTLTTILGALLMIAAFIFLSRRIMLMWEDIDLSVLVSQWAIMGLVIIALIEGTNIVLSALNFRSLITNVSGIAISKTLTLLIYCKSNLYKYIPGGVMFFIGRNQIVFKTKNLTHGQVALATLFEGILWIIVAITIAALYALNYPLYHIRKLDIMPQISVIALILIPIILIMLYLFRKGLLEIYYNLKKKNKNFRFSIIFKRFASIFIILNIWAFSFLLTLIIMGAEMSISLAFTVMGLYTLSWLAGFLVPISPGGIGIREAVLLVFLGTMINEGVLLSTMVMHRLLQVMGDVLGYGAALTYNKFAKEPTTFEKNN